MRTAIGDIGRYLQAAPTRQRRSLAANSYLRTTVTPRLAIILPCYNEADGLCENVYRVYWELDDLIRQGRVSEDSFLLMVDDGSTDRTWKVIQILNANEPHRRKAIKLARNYGHQAALFAGMMAVRERVDCAVTMDADGQHGAEVIGKFVEEFAKGSEIVFGVRKSNPSFLSDLFQWWMGDKIVRNHADFRLVSREAMIRLVCHDESSLFLRGIFAAMGRPHSIVEYDEKPRTTGRPSYNMVKRLRLAWDGLTWAYWGPRYSKEPRYQIEQVLM